MWPSLGHIGGRPGRTIVFGLGIVLALLALRFWLSVASVATRRGTLITVAMMVVVLLVFAVLGLRFFDLSGRREDRAARVQDCIRTRLREAMGDLPLTVVAAYASPSPRSPLVVEISGAVPSTVVRARALRVARGEAERLGRDVRVADRLEILVAQRPAA